MMRAHSSRTLTASKGSMAFAWVPHQSLMTHANSSALRGLSCQAACYQNKASAAALGLGLGGPRVRVSAAGPTTIGGGRSSPARRGLRCNALFEKFTERSIKSVMIAQQEAKWLGADEVSFGGACDLQWLRSKWVTLLSSPSPPPPPHACSMLFPPQVRSEHILLGLIAEDDVSKTGYLNCGITSEASKTAVEKLSGKKPSSGTSETINFSRTVRRTFEIASNVRAWASCSCAQLSPEW